MKKFIYILFVFTLVYSCSSDDEDSSTIIGCTDPDALNYNPEADQSGDICYYSVLGDWTALNYTVDGVNIFDFGYSYVDLSIYEDSSFLFALATDDGIETILTGFAEYDQSNNTATMTYDNGAIEYWEVTYIDGDELSVRVPYEGTISIIDFIRF